VKKAKSAEETKMRGRKTTTQLLFLTSGRNKKENEKKSTVFHKTRDEQKELHGDRMKKKSTKTIHKKKSAYIEKRVK
jgi:hypothetical protein